MAKGPEGAPRLPESVVSPLPKKYDGSINLGSPVRPLPRDPLTHEVDTSGGVSPVPRTHDGRPDLGSPIRQMTPEEAAFARRLANQGKKSSQ